jgi:hypothetical protein
MVSLIFAALLGFGSLDEGFDAMTGLLGWEKRSRQLGTGLRMAAAQANASERPLKSASATATSVRSARVSRWYSVRSGSDAQPGRYVNKNGNV